MEHKERDIPIGRKWDIDNEEWEILYIDPKEIKGVSKYNARKTLPELALDGLVKSLRELGINTRPIILDQNMEVIEGSRRYRAALKAGIPKVFCLKKHMSEKEARIRSFIENELALSLTNRDRYLFVKAMQDLNREELADIVGVSPRTLSEWAGYEKLPEVIKDTPVEEQIKLTSGRRKKLLKPILESPVLKTRPHDALKLTEAAAKGIIRDRDLEDLSKEIKAGGLDLYTSEKIERAIKESQERAPGIMCHVRFTKEEYYDLGRAVKLERPQERIVEAIRNICVEWAYNVLKKHGMMR